MWEAQSDTLQPGCVRTRVHAGGTALSDAETLERWIADESFRDCVSQLLVHAPFEAYCWETPAVARSTLDHPFEWVLIDVPALRSLPPEPEAFAERFSRCKAGESVAGFSNLGGDAFLVAPLPIDAESP